MWLKLILNFVIHTNKKKQPSYWKSTVWIGLGVGVAQLRVDIRFIDIPKFRPSAQTVLAFLACERRTGHHQLVNRLRGLKVNGRPILVSLVQAPESSRQPGGRGRRLQTTETARLNMQFIFKFQFFFIKHVLLVSVSSSSSSSSFKHFEG